MQATLWFKSRSLTQRKTCNSSSSLWRQRMPKSQTRVILPVVPNSSSCKCSPRQTSRWLRHHSRTPLRSTSISYHLLTRATPRLLSRYRQTKWFKIRDRQSLAKKSPKTSREAISNKRCLCFSIVGAASLHRKSARLRSASSAPMLKRNRF